MLVRQEERDEINCRRLLLNFYSSEITAHSRLLIGFGVIMFTLVEVRIALRELPLERTLLGYSAFFLASFALCYTFLRLLTYGALANSLVHSISVQGDDLLESIRDIAVNRAARQRIFGVVPVSWFLPRGKLNRPRVFGFALCVSLALVIAAASWWIVEYTL